MHVQNQFVDLYRTGIRTASDVAKISLETSVRLQEKQLDIVRNILQENTRSAERLTEARSVEELVALQTRLAGAQMERMAQFWSSLWQAAAENQKSLIEQVQSQIGQVAGQAQDFAANQASRAAGAQRKSA
jgi:phasin family protein